MLAYLAAPIDAYVGGEAIDRSEARVALREEGFTVYDPMMPWEAPRKDSGAVYDINEYALRRSDALLALWPDKASSIGVPMEIQTAHRGGKALSVCGGFHSLQLEGMGVQRWQYEDVGLAAAWLAEVVREKQREVTIPQVTAKVGATCEVKWAIAPGSEDAFIQQPTQGAYGDAGFDLYVAEDTTVPFNSFVDVPCGISIELPQGVWGWITGRSSTIRKRKLLVNTGIIDNGYRGPLFAAVWNMNDRAVKVEAGERIAQFIPMPLTAADLRWRGVDSLSESERGTNGFGSTGA